MRMTDIIYKKKHNQKLTDDEIEFFINGYVHDEIPDYQVSALLMAIWFNGMNEDETVALTKAMVNSGDIVDLSSIYGVKVDKHSTGGIGDKISLIVAPILASLGVPVAKMSGRGLGFTGGTIDKLESIEGFNANLTIDKFKENVENHGMSIISQTGNLVPADKKLYALRDVTETVDSIPLIASSIMSKKIASGSMGIVLDVKVGSGAFMKDLDSAEILAETMVNIGNKLKRKTIAVLSNMNQPLGSMIGNKLEVQEVVKFLKDNICDKELSILSTEIAARMFCLSGKTNSMTMAKDMVDQRINDGSAYNKFVEFVEAHGGNISSIDNLNVKYKHDVISDKEGYVSYINSEEIGLASVMLGAGRQTKQDTIDYDVGIEIKFKVGNMIKKGEKLFTIYSNIENIDDVESRLLNVIEVSSERVKVQPIIYKII